ncbi:hypothetical protein [Streptomyces sp. NPDC018610]|uniref:hypothetical protein n=1 Tax=Streptomyces sp. NPDC018610 TaxID=3365049 RepID=UPI003799DED3
MDPAYYSPSALSSDQWLTDNAQRLDFSHLSTRATIHASAFYEGLVERYTDSGVPFVRVGDVRDGSLDDSDLVYLPYDVAVSTDGLTAINGPLALVTKGGSVGNVGAVDSTDLLALSRDVMALKPRAHEDLSLLLFYLASSVGRSLLLRGASRQVQAHLTVERLKTLPIPHLSSSQLATLQNNYDSLVKARKEYDRAKSELAELIETSDPFVRNSQRHLFYTFNAMEDLRRRMDPEHHRPSQAKARDEAIRQGWRSLGDISYINQKSWVWDREKDTDSRLVEYVALSSVQEGSGRINKATTQRVWQTPSRAKWRCHPGHVLAPSLVESLKRVALVSEAESESIASSGFHVLSLPSIDEARFVAAYLLSKGAHEQILRSGTGVRFRSYNTVELARLLIPPKESVAEISQAFRSVEAHARNLDAVWASGVMSLENMLGMPSATPISGPEEPNPAE